MVVVDNASNIKKALREGNFEPQGRFAQLVVSDGVLSQRSVIDTVAVCCRGVLIREFCIYRYR